MKNKALYIFIFALIFTSCSAFAQTEYPLIEAPVIEYPLATNTHNVQDYDADKLKGSVVMVPANTTFPAVLTNGVISSESLKTGDSVSFYMNSDFYYGNNLIAPEGSKVVGSVVKVKKGKYASIDGLVKIRFSNIVTPSGQVIPISASIQTEDGSGVLKAGTFQEAIASYTKDAVFNVGSGAILGTIGGAIGGDVGNGTIAGTAIGGAVALIKILSEKGDDVFIPQNSQMNIILDQPITFSSNNPY